VRCDITVRYCPLSATQVLPVSTLVIDIVCAIFVLILGTKPGIWSIVVISILAGIITLSISQLARDYMMIAGPFAAPFVLLAAGLGVASGTLLREKNFVVGAILLILPALLVARVYWQEHRTEDVKSRGMAFITSEKHVVALLGQPVRAELVTWQEQDNIIHHLEYSLHSQRKVYAIVDVSYHRSEPSFRLMCVISAMSWNLSAQQGACQKDLIDMPQVP